MAERGALRSLPSATIVRCIADAARRWCDADFAPRVRVTAGIESRLGYTTPVVDYALDTLFGGMASGALEAAIASEVGSLRALDGVVPRDGAPAGWARGVERVVIVSSDTTIGVALLPAAYALCAKCDVVVKDRSDALAAAFFATLAEEDQRFATAAQARAWSGGDDPEERALLSAADVVVAFGGDQALSAIRERCSPNARFVPFGHRVSIGRLTRADAAVFGAAGAERIARDALLYDGEGCLSMHALFVHAEASGLDPEAAALADACERVAVEFPGGARSPQRVAAVAAYRSLSAFRAAGGRGAVYRAADATLVVDAPRDEPPPLLPRVVPLIAVRDDDDVAAYCSEQGLPVQALGVDNPDDAAIALAERIGAVRVAPFGSLQTPPAGGHHGGEPRIAHFVRWMDCERPGSA